MKARPAVAVVVCAYTEQRWGDILAAYVSLMSQTVTVAEVVLVVDHNPSLMARLKEALPDARVIANKGTQGLSGARNTRIAATKADVVMFLDDDARAQDDWVALMVSPFESDEVVGVAGRAIPLWAPPGRPAWFPEFFFRVVGCSYEGLPTERTDNRNPLGCAMAFRRTSLELVGGFSETVGRVGETPVGWEETKLAISVRQAQPSARVVLEPRALVHHRVAAPRLRVSYFLNRCFWEGVSKAIVAKGVGFGDALSSERGYAVRVLPRAFSRGVRDVLGGKPSGILRSAAIVAGLLVTSLGYAGGISGTTNLRPEAPTKRSVAA